MWLRNRFKSPESKQHRGQLYVPLFQHELFSSGFEESWNRCVSSSVEILRMLSSGIVGRSSGKHPSMMSSRMCLLLDGIMEGTVDFLLLAIVSDCADEWRVRNEYWNCMELRCHQPAVMNQLSLKLFSYQDFPLQKGSAPTTPCEPKERKQDILKWNTRM